VNELLTRTRKPAGVGSAGEQGTQKTQNCIAVVQDQPDHAQRADTPKKDVVNYFDQATHDASSTWR